MASKYLEHPPLTTREKKMLAALRLAETFAKEAIHADQWWHKEVKDTLRITIAEAEEAQS